MKQIEEGKKETQMKPTEGRQGQEGGEWESRVGGGEDGGGGNK